MEIPNETISELSKALAEAKNETQINLAIGSGVHLKNGKMVKYVIGVYLVEKGEKP